MIKQTIGQRKYIVKQPDGTTKIIQQSVTMPQPQPKPEAQKVQIIRGPDGKVSVRGLNPGQQLIQMPDGKLHVLTSNQGASSAQNKGTIIKSATGPKVVITKSPQTTTTVNNAITPQATAVGKSPVVIRQQIQKPATTLVQKVQTVKPGIIPQQKTLSISSANQINAGAKVQISSTPTIQKILTSTGQIVTATTSNANQKIITPTNLQQLLTQSGTQKIVVNQNQPQKIVLTSQNTIASQANTQTCTSQQQQQQQIVVQSPQQIVVNQNGQKVVQQIISPQQIMIGNQRLIINSSPRIQVQQQPQQQQIVLQQQQSPIQQQTQISQQQVQQQTIIQPQPQIQQQSPPVQQQTQQIQQQTVATQPQTQQQIIIQNSTMAQQIATGKLQIAQINGQNVVIRHIGNNQAQIVGHIRTQTDGAQVITNTTATPQPAANIVTHQTESVQQQNNIESTEIVTPMQSPQKITTIQQQQSPNTSLLQQQQTQQNLTIEQSLLQGQPPGTVIKCVTAQVIQTQQGPRIVLQGLTGNDFTPQQLILVQQQVKQQLLKGKFDTCYTT